MAPACGGKLPLFAKGSDGTADFGDRYNPLTGTPCSPFAFGFSTMGAACVHGS